ncbi:MAG: hypothetical protein ABI588_05430 [Arenimonas sp.]
MSFELFLQSFAAGAPSGIPLATLRAAFGAALTEPEVDFWQVHYGQAQSSDLFLRPLPTDAHRVHTISIYRPCSSAGLFESIWQLLACPGTCLYFPGGPAPLSRDAAIAGALPSDLLAALGTPTMVHSAGDIAAVIGAHEST